MADSYFQRIYAAEQSINEVEIHTGKHRRRRGTDLANRCRAALGVDYSVSVAHFKHAATIYSLTCPPGEGVSGGELKALSLRLLSPLVVSPVPS